MKKPLKRLLLIFVILLALGISGYAFFRLTPEPPLAEIEAARLGLAVARDNKAELYSKDVFAQANRLYDSAMAAWKAENQKFILLRDYSQVKAFASSSEKKSTEALHQTKENSSSLESRLKIELEQLNRRVKEISNLFNGFPLPGETRSQISKGKLLLSEGQVAFQNSNFVLAEDNLSKAGYLLHGAYKYSEKVLREYFNSFSEWKSLMDQAIAQSRQKGTPVIIVDKYARKCFIYKNGVKTDEFDAELGKNWVGDKRHKGDYATPEGHYKITQKKEKGRTRYYKALLLDYPNEDDKVRFRNEIAKGRLPASAKIGGLIEVHGHGGRGADWTEGCIALTDSDMDKIYRMVNVGTPVTIIGSAVDLKTILNN